jgi:invasion protein IalB
VIRSGALALALLLALSPRAGAEDAEWRVDCPDKGRCVAFHDVMVRAGADSASLMLRASFAKSDQGPVVLLALLPLGIFLPAGVLAAVDDAPPLPLVVQRCVQNGCEAGQALTPEAVKALRHGKLLKIAFKAVPEGDTLVVEVPLKHVGKALDKLK